MRKAMMAICIALGLVLAVSILTRTRTESEQEVNLGAFTTEVMIIKIDGDQTQLAMWFPFEFFVEADLQDRKSNRASAESDLAFLKPYITIIVQCSTDKPDGTSIYANEKAVAARAVLQASDGTTLEPLKTVPPMLSVAVSAMKQMMAAEGDAGGENMHILVFPNKTKDGKALIDANRKGSLKLVLKASGNFKDSTFVWKTPFDAMKSVPPCPKCNEQVSAKWTFCPWCGARLPQN